MLLHENNKFSYFIFDIVQERYFNNKGILFKWYFISVIYCFIFVNAG